MDQPLFVGNKEGTAVIWVFRGEGQGLCSFDSGDFEKVLAEYGVQIQPDPLYYNPNGTLLEGANERWWQDNGDFLEL